MEKRTLGETGIELPVVGMGTWRTFDVEGAERNARKRLVRQALDLDVRLFDSSPMYGAAEEVLAHALRANRDEAIIATKIWAATRVEGVHQVRHALELYGGKIDIYQVHNLRAWHDHVEELERRKALGEVRAIGLTHYNAAAYTELEEAMKTGRFDMIQIPYNLIDKSAEKKILPLAQKLKMGILAMEPLGTGVLPKKAPAPELYAPFLDERTKTFAQVCLKWVLSEPRITAVIPATSNPDHLNDNAAVGDGPWYDAKERAAIAALIS